jgi:outer membrane protein assembly factor BamB
VIADGRVYVTDYCNQTYAFSAETGELLWEFKDQPIRFENNQGWRGPVRSGGVLVVGGRKTVGLDPATGKRVWETETAMNYRNWTSGGKSFVLLEVESQKYISIICLDPTDGKKIWTGQSEIPAFENEYPLISGDWLLGGIELTGPKPADADAFASVVSHRLTPQGLTPGWKSDVKMPIVDKLALAVSPTVVYASGVQGVVALDLTTGKQLAQVSGTDGARTHHLRVVDGRLILDPEGRHGTTNLFLLNADPKDLKVLGGKWWGGYPTTTAYGVMPLYHPIDDGRMVMHGRDGLYAFDLRAGK